MRKRDGEATKKAILQLLSDGHTVESACKALGKSRSTYGSHRKNDPVFAAKADAAIAKAKGDASELILDEVPDFPEFCELLGMPLSTHQLQWYDLLEGREPRDLHEAMVYEPGDPDLLVVNTPPFHAKSTTLTRNYCAWRIYKNPAVRIILVSKKAGLAEQFLGGIKQLLTHPQYEEIWSKFGPPAGWDHNSQSWKQNLIYVSDDVRPPDEKDPTVQALGIGGSIYGARADLIILDDCVDNTNAHDYEKQVHWIESEVLNRVPDGGKLIVIGTRMAPKDLYGELRAKKPEVDEDDPDEEPGGWTYFAQPAILEPADKVEDWVTLWPKSPKPIHPDRRGTVPDENGLYEAWNGRRLNKKRRQITDPARWARVFMQASVAADQMFQPDDVNACVQPRSPGIIPNDPKIGREGGMSGLRILAGLDPAAGGCTAMVCYGVDINTGKRWIIDVFNKARTSNEELEATVFEWTETYGIQEWRVESNAFQSHLVNDIRISKWMAQRGVLWQSHTTGRNKHDADLGVAAMASLFRHRLISLPRTTKESVRALVEQLTTWAPELPKGHKTDTVMALWFAELRALELVGRAMGADQGFMDNPFLSSWDMAQRRVVNAHEYDSDEPTAGWW